MIGEGGTYQESRKRSVHERDTSPGAALTRYDEVARRSRFIRAWYFRAGLKWFENQSLPLPIEPCGRYNLLNPRNCNAGQEMDTG